MNIDDARTSLHAVFREVFDDDALEISDSTVREDLPAWDSLGHIRLVSAMEEAFDVSFSIEEIEEMTGVGRILDTILAKA
jgi:acyl carrier protein